MTMFYVDAQYGSDSNSGTSTSAPVQTTAQAIALLSANPSASDTLRMSGTYRKGDAASGFLTLVGLSNKTIEAWPTSDNANLPSGMTITRPKFTHSLVSGTWTHSGGGVYTSDTPLATGLSISALTYGWGQATSALSGAYYGFCVRCATSGAVATAAAGSATEGFFHYNSGTGVVTAYFGGDNPNTSGKQVGYSTVELTEAAVYLRFCNSITVSGIDIGPLPKYSGQYGWAVRGEGSTGIVIDDIKAYDCGAHSIGTLGGFADGSNWLIKNCTMIGLSPNGTHGISHQSGGTGNLTGHTYSGCTIKAIRWLGINDAVLSARSDSAAAMANNTQICIYGHSDTSNIIRGIDIDTCVFINLEAAGQSTRMYACDDALATSFANRWTASTYPMRVDRCTVTNFNYQNIGGNAGHISTKRTVFTTDKTATAGFGNGGLFWGLVAANSSDYYFLFESCTFVGSLDGGGDETRFFSAQQSTGGTKRMLLKNCSVYNTGTNTARFCGIFDTTYDGGYNVAHFEAVGCIFAHRVTGGNYCLFIRDGSNQLAGNLIKDCLYYNIDNANSRYAQIATYNAAAWVANVDTSATVAANVLSANPYANMTTLTPTSTVLALARATSAIVPAYGINNLPYSGEFGAFQYGGISSIPAGTVGTTSAALMQARAMRKKRQLQHNRNMAA